MSTPRGASLTPASPERAGEVPGGRSALLLLLAINLVCYLDRYLIPAIATRLEEVFFPFNPAKWGAGLQGGFVAGMGDLNAASKISLLTPAFMVSYMLLAPIFGWLADRYSRWLIIGISVALWSIACGATGLAGSFTALLLTRVFLGVGEAGYGPAAPTILSDHFPVERRGRVMAWFFMAIPVGSALGFALGGLADHFLGWRWAFFLMTPPGLLLALLCFLRKDPPRKTAAGEHARPTAADYRSLLRIPSLAMNILAQTAMTFAIGGLGAWVPTYLVGRGMPLSKATTIFGAILAVTGLTATLLGGWLGDRLRQRFKGAYFLVSGSGMLLGFPATVAMLYVPFPYAWGCIFCALFFLFLNTGPANTALANVTPPALRATAFAANILVIHLLGDVFSPTIIAVIHDHASWNAAFLTVSFVMLIAAVLWLASMRQLARDTEVIEKKYG